jgi:hypothetical protein
MKIVYLGRLSFAIDVMQLPPSVLRESFVCKLNMPRVSFLHFKGTVVFCLFSDDVIVQHYVASHRRVTGDDKCDKTWKEAVAALSRYFPAIPDKTTDNVRVT